MTATTDPARLRKFRVLVATACRILAHQGLAADVLGHVSVRLDDHRILLRCRGPEERGLLFTVADDVRIVDLDGRGELGGGYAVPNEFPIHTELYRARPDARAVVHAHPCDVLVADLAGVGLRQVFGAYNIPASRLAGRGIPVYPRSVLISTPELGRAVATAVGESDVCILRGHGVVTAGESVQHATMRALDLVELARISTQIALLGGRPDVLRDNDLAELPDLGTSFNDTSRWRHYAARLNVAGLAL